MKLPLQSSTNHRSVSAHLLRSAPARTLHAVILLLIFIVILIPVAQAQQPVRDLAALEVELWPDFDRPAVLVLLTGTLADDVPVPATVTIPLPEEATLNAVAHANIASGALENVADVDSSTPGLLTFTAPSPTFRIEYYVPYSKEGDRHEYTFEWQSDMTIDQVLATIQEPAEAVDFELSPAADESATGRDGLVYHAVGARALPAGQILTLTTAYDLPGGQLSADVIDLQQPAVEGPLPLVSEPAESGGLDLNWPLVAIVAGGLIVVAAVAWFLYTNSNTGRKRASRPRPARVSKSGGSRPSGSAGAQFCHNCGQAVDDDDRFCRQCGTPVKGR